MPDDLPQLIRTDGEGRRRRVRFVGWALVVAVAGLMLLLFLHYARLRANTEALARQLEAEARARFARVPPLEAAEASALRTHLNRTHVQRARQLGVSAINDRAEAEALVEQQALVPLATTGYYRVEPMYYSIPYVTASTANLLTVIGRRFQEQLREAGLPPYRFVITSGTRTSEDQQALRRVNINAAAESSHEFGAAVDVHYHRFDYAAGQDTLPEADRILPVYLDALAARSYDRLASEHRPALKALLGRTLRELQQEGKLLVIYERRQPVYHLTVGQRIPELAPPAPRPPDPTPPSTKPPTSAAP